MGKKVKIGFLLFIMIFIGVFATKTFAGSTDPGSINDPLVTKSYVDEQIRLMSEELSVQLSEQISEQISGNNEEIYSNKLVVEQLNRGDILIAKTGTEVILRSGAAIAYGDGSNGIPDITGGADLKIGSNIPTNHQLIFPRDDGRGIEITASPAYVMITGEYEIISNEN